jgi:rhodanese-related sulfurtransferase
MMGRATSRVCLDVSNPDNMDMGLLHDITERARQRGRELNLPYTGALLPGEAYQLMLHAPGTTLVDVRSRAELDLAGTIPGATHVEWQSYPGWVANPYFLAQVREAADPESMVMFICRSGHRSHKAAIAAQEAGFTHCYNVLEGLEGDVSKATGHRNELGGWKLAGLPWQQS